MPRDTSRTTIKRGAFRRADCVFIGAWFPSQWVEEIDRRVAAEDVDRSKLLRRAVMNALLHKEAA